MTLSEKYKNRGLLSRLGSKATVGKRVGTDFFTVKVARTNTKFKVDILDVRESSQL